MIKKKNLQSLTYRGHLQQEAALSLSVFGAGELCE